MRNFIYTLALFITVQCSLSTGTTKNTSIYFEGATLNTDPTIQAQYKAEWIKHTKSIKRGSYHGSADVWGDGALAMDFWFDNGNLWDAMTTVDNLPYVLYHLLSGEKDPYKPSWVNENDLFLDGKTAIMYLPNSAASPRLAGNLYLVRITNNELYRTKDSGSGFARYQNWNSTTIPSHDLIKIADRIALNLDPEMITSGHKIIYQKDNKPEVTLQFTSSDSVSEIPSSTINKISFKEQGIDIYLDTSIPYSNNSSLERELNLKDENQYFRYHFTIQDHKITKIKITSLIDLNKLNPTLFEGEHQITYHRTRYSTQGPPPAHGWKTYKYTINANTFSIDHSEGNIIWMKSSADVLQGDLIPLDRTKDIAKEVIYTVNPKTITLKIQNNKITDLYDTTKTLYK